MTVKNPYFVKFDFRPPSDGKLHIWSHSTRIFVCEAMESLGEWEDFIREDIFGGADVLIDIKYISRL